MYGSALLRGGINVKVTSRAHKRLPCKVCDKDGFFGCKALIFIFDLGFGYATNFLSKEDTARLCRRFGFRGIEGSMHMYSNEVGFASPLAWH